MIAFEEILRMRQKELKHYLSGYLKKAGYSVINKKGFLYAKGEVPVLLVAHLDTVHQESRALSANLKMDGISCLRRESAVMIGAAYI